VTAVRQLWDGGVAIATRDWLLFRSYRMRFFTQFIGGLFTVTLFYYISQIVSSSAFDSPEEYFAFVVVGLVVMEVLVGTLSTVPLAVRQELVAGTLERLVVSPFGTVAAVTSMLAFPFLIAFIRGVVTLTIAGLVFGLPVEWETAPLAVPVALAGALAFAPFALMVAAAVLRVKQAGAGTGLIMGLLALVGGFFFPVALLPDWIEWASEVQPFTPALDLLRNLLVGTPLEGSALGALARIGLFAVALMPVGVWVLGLAVRSAQRRGTITEY
jgi:ABC-2 type transport system permease protein